MTATQAPTPGPLSAHPCYDEHQPGCGCVISEQTASPMPSYLERLAPTAPVEASGSEREAVARLTKDVATVKSFSANAATFYDGPNKRYIGDVAADIETVLALLSARPLALGCQQ